MTTKYITTHLSPLPGSFCRPRAFVDGRYIASNWYHCREVFHGRLYRMSLFFFSHDAGRGESVAEFIGKVEEKLGIPRSEFGPTQRKTITWIKPSKWWHQGMRRSLFTILLRCGTRYSVEKDNFEAALYTGYARKTRYAVDRFLSGHTEYTGHRRGWYRAFFGDSPSESEVDLLLI